MVLRFWPHTVARLLAGHTLRVVKPAPTGPAIALAMTLRRGGSEAPALPRAGISPASGSAVRSCRLVGVLVGHPRAAAVFAGELHVAVHEQHVHAAGNVVVAAPGVAALLGFVIQADDLGLGPRSRRVVDVRDEEALNALTQAVEGCGNARAACRCGVLLRWFQCRASRRQDGRFHRVRVQQQPTAW